jgi:hypothetical protein
MTFPQHIKTKHITNPRKIGMTNATTKSSTTIWTFVLHTPYSLNCFCELPKSQMPISCYCSMKLVVLLFSSQCKLSTRQTQDCNAAA